MKSKIENDEGNTGIITEERIKENQEEEQRTKTILVFKILNKLEQRIATLEKVLESHAKCIGEMREDKNDNNWNGKRNN